MENTEIAVGDSVKLEIIFSTSSYQGQVVKRPLVCIDRDSLCHQIELRINVVANPDSIFPAVVSPYKLSLNSIGGINIVSTEFKISNRSDSVIHIRLIDWPQDYFSVSSPSRLNPGGTIESQLFLSPMGRLNSFEKSMTIECDDAARSRFTVPVARRIYSPSRTTTATINDSKCPD